MFKSENRRITGRTAAGVFSRAHPLPFFLTVCIIILAAGISSAEESVLFEINPVDLPGIGDGTASPADLDMDGDLDVLLTGRRTVSGHLAELYERTGSIFTEVGSDLSALACSSADWADLERDGDLDIILNGRTPDGQRRTVVYTNDAGNFTELGASLRGVSYGRVEWGDMDNDGDPDILLTGRDWSGTGWHRIGIIYRNDTGIFNDSYAALTGVSHGSAEWGDFDSDGDLDVLLAGLTETAESVTKIFRNEGGRFTEVETDLPGVSHGNATWGDCDADGDLDILLTGRSSSYGETDRRVTGIYLNEGGEFTDLAANLPRLEHGAAVWVDTDTDGYLDVVLAGTGDEGLRAGVFLNRDGAFMEAETNLPPLRDCSITCGDIDGDGRSDLIMTGKTADDKPYTGVCLSQSGEPNHRPSAPGGFKATRIEDSIRFSWDEASDNETASPGLTYALNVGTRPGTGDILTANAGESGRRHTPGRGNCGHNLYKTVTGLDPSSEYFCTVQAVDTSGMGSAWSPELIVPPGDALQETKLSCSNIVENSPPGTPVGTLLTISPNGPVECSYELLPEKAGGMFNLRGNTLENTHPPDYETARAHSVLIQIVYSDGTGDIRQFQVNVLPVNEPPVITPGLFQEAIAGREYVHQIIVNDPDDHNNGKDLRYELLNAPSAMTVSPLGVIRWIPSSADTSSGTFTVKVSDGGEDGVNPVSIQMTVPVRPPRPAGAFTDSSIREAARVRITQRDRHSLEQALLLAKNRKILVRGVNSEGQAFELTKISEGDGQPLYHVTNNADAGISTATDLLRHTDGPGQIEGAGYTVGLWDEGIALSTHESLQAETDSRVKVMNPGSSKFHATHIAGTIGGNGITDSAIGMAPAVTIESYNWYSDAGEMTARAAAEDETDNLLISNHSYSYINGWYRYGSEWYWFGKWGDREVRNFGRYCAESRDWDNIVHSAPYYLPFAAAGNDRNDAPDLSEGDTFYQYDEHWSLVEMPFESGVSPLADNHDSGGFDSIADGAVAKNIMTVGAVTDTVTDGVRDLSKAGMTTFSCWGPCDDGRIKPDIVANGYRLYSAHNYNDSYYTASSGTSMAAPNASGSAVLLQEYYHDLHGVHMRASTLKGVIIHTADDLGETGPDYKYGWGLMNVQGAAELINGSAEFRPGTVCITEDTLYDETERTYGFTWDGTNRIRATLCWTDPPHDAIYDAVDTPTSALINDMDIRITAPDGTQYMPWTLNPADPSAPAATGDNDIDNVEQVIIPDPVQEGRYTVTVSHKDHLDAAQNISLILSGQTETAGPALAKAVPDQTAAEGNSFIYTLPPDTFEHENRDELVISGYLEDNSPLPGWLSFDSQNHTFTGTPEKDDIGVLKVKVTASDSMGETAADVFILAVIHVNLPPQISSIPDITIREDSPGEDLAFTLQDEDTPQSQLLLSVRSADHLLVSPSSLILSGTDAQRILTVAPVAGTVGSTAITVTASDGVDATQETFTITVTPNTPPTMEDQTLLLAEDAKDGSSIGSLLAEDYDHDPLLFSLVSGSPAGLFTLNPDTGELILADSSCLDADAVPCYRLDARVSDPWDSTEAAITVQIESLEGDTPVLSDQSFSVPESSPAGTVVGTLEVQQSGDGGLLFGLGGDGSGRTFTIGEQSGAITVSDGADLDYEKRTHWNLEASVTTGEHTASGVVEIVVVDVNEPPVVIVNSRLHITEGATVIITGSKLSVLDQDNAPGSLVYTLNSPPLLGNLRLDGTRLWTGNTFTQSDIDQFRLGYEHVPQTGCVPAEESFSFTVSDGTNSIEARTFRITVAEPLLEFANDCCRPAFCDIDADKTPDLFVGKQDGSIQFYRNTATETGYFLEEQIGIANPLGHLDSGYHSAPAFVDLDQDGDLDALTGNSEGKFLYAENMGTEHEPRYVTAPPGSHPFSGLDVGHFSAPVFSDVDGDSDPDLFSGCYAGTVAYFENIGTATQPEFRESPAWDNPLGDVDVGAYSSPVFVDIDVDGDLDCLIGEQGGSILYFQNAGTASEPLFIRKTRSDNAFSGIDSGEFSTPRFADIDCDGSPEFFVGTGSGVYLVTDTPANCSPAPIELDNDWIEEAAACGTTVGTLIAQDPDGTSEEHNFTLVAGTGDSDNRLFEVIGRTLQTASALTTRGATLYSIRVQVSDGVSMPYQQALTVRAGTETFDLELHTGWNMVAVPCVPTDCTTEAVLQNRQAGTVWEWDTTGREYIPSTEMVPGNGYWVFRDSPATTVLVTGYPHDEVCPPLTAGWNLIGVTRSISSDRAAGNMTISAGWSWNGFTQNYDSLLEEDPLLRGIAYWLFAEP